jgi:hypothetical protein
LLALRKNPDVNGAGFEEEALHRIAAQSLEETCLPAMPDEDLRDPVSVCIVKDHAYDVLAMEQRYACAGVPRGLQVSIERLLVGGGKIVLFDIGNEELAMEAIGLAFAAFDHQTGIGPGRNAHQDTFVNAIRLLDAVAVEVSHQLCIDGLGCEDQGNLTELG